MSIGSKLIFSFLLVTLLPTILVAFLTTRIINKSMEEEAHETIDNSLKAAWMQYKTRAHQMQLGMLQASTEFYIKKAVKNREKEFLRRQLEAWKANRPNVDLWVIVDPEGIVIASLNTEGSGTPLAMNGLVEKAVREGKPFISTEVIPHRVLARERLEARAAVTGEKGVLRDGLLLTVVTPVMDEGGLSIGAIITGDLVNNDSYVPDTFREAFPDTLLAITLGDAYVTTNAFVGKERALGHSVPPEVFKEAVGRGSFMGETTFGGRLYISGVEPIRDNRGRAIGAILVSIPKERFIELQYKNMKAIVSVALIGISIAGFAGFVLTYMITRPILVLKKKAQLVSSGDLNVSTAVKKADGDEISDLANTFDRMVKSLREHEESIRVGQEKLKEQKNLVESIINSIPCRLYVIDRNLGIVVWNRHQFDVCQVCGRCPEESYFQMNFMDHLLHEELREGLPETIENIFRTGKPVEFVKKIEHREEKRESHIRVSIFPIFSEKRRYVDYVVWMGEDITKLKEMESSVLASEKLAAIGQLAAGVAHEVNNPLGGILNCLYNIKHMKLTEERKAEYLSFMEDGIKRVQNIVRGLLDFSQQHTPKLTLTDINALIERLVPLFLHSVKGKDVRLVKNLGEGLPSILVDSHQIEQVFVNLLLNAIQAVDGAGLITISTRIEDGQFCVAVSDNGCGIPAQNIQRVFDPFFTTKGVGEGTGLGLSVSRGIIERHRGRIEVESRLGEGTVFRVYLPTAA